MKRIRTQCYALFLVAALSASITAAASAAKVPGFLLLPGESGALSFSGASTAAWELQGVSGTLTGTGVKLLVTLTPGSDDEGTYTADFERAINKAKESCNTSGDGAGTILVPSNLVRAVHDITATTGNGLLFEVKPEFEVICGSGVDKIKYKGTFLGLFEGVGTKQGNDFTEFAVALYCNATSGGAPFEENFWGLSGVAEKAKFEANFGTGFKTSCVLVGTVAAATRITLKTNKMTELMEAG